MFAFISTKSYLNVEQDLGLPGAPWFYASFAIGGAVILYFILPETEGCTLEDIERHFAEKGRRLTDRNIKTHSKVSKAKELDGDGNGVYKKTTVED